MTTNKNTLVAETIKQSIITFGDLSDNKTLELKMLLCSLAFYDICKEFCQANNVDLMDFKAFMKFSEEEAAMFEKIQMQLLAKNKEELDILTCQ